MSKPKKEAVITEDELLSELQRIAAEVEIPPSDNGFVTAEDMAQIYKKQRNCTLDSAIRHVRKLLKVALINGRLDDTGTVRKMGLGKPAGYPCTAYRFLPEKK